MGVFDIFKSKTGRFVSADSFKKNVAVQTNMTPQTLAQLSNYGITDDSKLSLEYFFYTNTEEKASNLANDLRQRSYSVEHGASADDSKVFIVTGWTTKINMGEAIMVKWTEEMCHLGFKFDCDFDGWGTNPEQE